MTKKKTAAKPAAKKTAAKPRLKAKAAAPEAVTKKMIAKPKKPAKAASRKAVTKAAAKAPLKKTVVKKPPPAATKPAGKSSRAPAKKVARPAAKKTIKPVAKKTPVRKASAKKSRTTSRGIEQSPAVSKPVFVPSKKKLKPAPAPRARAVKPPKKTDSPKRKPRQASGLKRYAEVLKNALAIKKPAGPQVESLLRPEYGESGRTSQDAERLLGVSRKVH